mgnify:CR=1 FL=1|jgi:phosphoribosyl-dephospho-CoA transferase
MSVIKAISAPFRLAKWCVVGEKLECVESAKRIGKLLKAEKRVIQQKSFLITTEPQLVSITEQASLPYEYNLLITE